MGHLSTFPAAQTWPDGVGTLRLAELLGALSHALDATEGQPVGHAIRVTWLGCDIGRRLGLTGTDLHDLYYTLLLKDLGCSSNAARICQLYLADDLEFKRAFKRVDGTTKSALQFLLRETARGGSLVQRGKTLVSVIRNAAPIVDDLIETRCEQGAMIARMMGFSARVADGIHALDEHWDGSGRPDRRTGTAIPLGARIALVAQVADVFMTNGSTAAARTEIAGRSNGWFDPDVVAAALAALDDPAVLSAMRAPDLAQRVFAHPAAAETVALDDAALDRIIGGFAHVIDAKSPFTQNHSGRVAACVDDLTAALGLDANARRWLRRAALLHGIGKLGVSNRILDKAGRLDPPERALIEAHTTTGRTILHQITIFAQVAHLAAAHHERLDGKGYPQGLTGAQLCRDVRILTTADIYDALSAERPYKPAYPPDKVRAIMDDMVGTAIDPACYAALRDLRLA